jgi:predicted DNA-binding protein with PD1-like motif
VQTIAIRLHPGNDLRQSLLQVAHDQPIAAGFILSGIGSLKQAAIRFANQKHATILTGYFEIVTLAGTLSNQGVHLHMAIASQSGRVIGGHVSDGCLIYTTAELVIGLLDAVSFCREPDPQTGFAELLIQAKEI